MLLQGAGRRRRWQRWQQRWRRRQQCPSPNYTRLLPLSSPTRPNKARKRYFVETVRSKLWIKCTIAISRFEKWRPTIDSNKCNSTFVDHSHHRQIVAQDLRSSLSLSLASAGKVMISRLGEERRATPIKRTQRRRMWVRYETKKNIKITTTRRVPLSHKDMCS